MEPSTCPRHRRLTQPLPLWVATTCRSMACYETISRTRTSSNGLSLAGNLRRNPRSDGQPGSPRKVLRCCTCCILCVPTKSLCTKKTSSSRACRLFLSWNSWASASRIFEALAGASRESRSFVDASYCLTYKIKPELSSSHVRLSFSLEDQLQPSMLPAKVRLLSYTDSMLTFGLLECKEPGVAHCCGDVWVQRFGCYGL